MEGTPTIEGVRKSFASHQDLAVAKSIQELLQEWAAATSAQQDSAAARLAEAQERVQAAQVQAQRTEPAEEHDSRVHELLQQEQQVKAAVEATLQEIRGREEAQQAMRKHEQQLRRSVRRLNAVCDDDEPRCRYQLSLYAHISNIAWDKADEGRVAGVVSDLASQRMQPFSIDARAQSHFDVVQQVWAAVG